MNAKRIIGTGLVLSLVASIGLVLGTPRAAHASHDDSRFGDRVRVDCDDGESINRAIRRSDLSEKLTIVVRGTCVENVVIDRDWVTLQPHDSGGSIEAADDTKPVILITGRHVTVQDFDGASISGGRTGILVGDGGSASILNNDITGTEFGLLVTNGSVALVEGNLIDHNVWGVVVGQKSTARFSDNTIVLNDEIGLIVQVTSSVRIFSGNSISNNGQNTTRLPRRWTVPQSFRTCTS
ncbi:MAG: right-handed parallel beta-helix repeat-containing protein [Proteobacteria bacterium]|nr:right-handed parallel beta-helix repeat-containing protein [Pseudomonadota bacterium]